MFGYRHDMKWIFQKIYFGKDRLTHRKNIWFTQMSEPYEKRERYVKNFTYDFHLSSKEVMQCLILLSDSSILTDVHSKLFLRLVELNKVKSNADRITQLVFTMVNHDQYLKIHRYCYK